VDLDAFATIARKQKPRLVALGMSMTLFPLPVREMSEIIAEWGGKFYFDGAYQAGLIAVRKLGPILQAPIIHNRAFFGIYSIS
jgi:glycine/serine hydroxymethyltransferase